MLGYRKVMSLSLTVFCVEPYHDDFANDLLKTLSELLKLNPKD